MTEEEFIDEVANLPGVGEAKARALYEAGYETVDALREASEDELAEVEGVGPGLAETIAEGVEAPEEAADETSEPEPEPEAEAEDEPETEAEPEAEEEPETEAEPEAEEEPEAAFVEEVADLPGVGESKARALHEAGYETVDALREASEDELNEVDGIGPRIAEAIVEGLAAREEPAEEQEIEVVDEEPEPEEEEVEAVAEEEHVPKAKPDLPEDIERALEVREAVSESRPSFVRQQAWEWKRIPGDVWRRPRGEESSQRVGKSYRPAAVDIGYRGPKKARGLHPSGFEEVLVHNPDDLSEIDPDRQAARIGGSVGGRKREAIEDRADELGVRVLNPTQEGRQ